MYSKTYKVEEIVLDKGVHPVHVYEGHKHRIVYVPSSDIYGFTQCLQFLGFKINNLMS